MDINEINATLAKAIAMIQEEEKEGLADIVQEHAWSAGIKEAKEKDRIIDVTATVTWRGSPVPKKYPLHGWLASLNGKLEKTRLREVEKTSRFWAKDLNQIIEPTGLSRMFSWAESEMKKAAKGNPAYLVQIGLVADVPDDVSTYQIAGGKKHVTLAAWDAWSKKWQEGQYAQDFMRACQAEKTESKKQTKNGLTEAARAPSKQKLLKAMQEYLGAYNHAPFKVQQRLYNVVAKRVDEMAKWYKMDPSDVWNLAEDAARRKGITKALPGRNF